MNLVFSPQAWEDYQHWVESDRKLVKRINDLIKDAVRSPLEGIGKPEPLRHALAGFWSRRINDEHRMVYRVAGNTLSCASTTRNRFRCRTPEIIGSLVVDARFAAQSRAARHQHAAPTQEPSRYPRPSAG